MARIAGLHESVQVRATRYDGKMSASCVLNICNNPSNARQSSEYMVVI